jgi:hypothetical protein
MMKSPLFWATCLVAAGAFTLTEEIYIPIYNTLKEILGDFTANIIGSTATAIFGIGLAFLGYKILKKFIKG